MRQKPITNRKALMPRIPVVLGLFVGLLAAVAVAGSAASAGAATASQLDNKAGWTCIAPQPVSDELHCFGPKGFERFIANDAKVVKALVFDPSGQEFLGVEVNVRDDVFHGQPCPTDPPTYEYTYLRPIFLPLGLDLDYWACHRFDSDHT
jgi:hypothetical protein